MRACCSFSVCCVCIIFFSSSLVCVELSFANVDTKNSHSCIYKCDNSLFCYTINWHIVATILWQHDPNEWLIHFMLNIEKSNKTRTTTNTYTYKYQIYMFKYGFVFLHYIRSNRISNCKGRSFGPKNTQF